MNIPQLNRDYYHNEAEKARKEESEKPGDINRYEFVNGDNILRLMPPYSSKGLIFKKVITHFNLPLEDAVQKCLFTWGDLFDFCPICDALIKSAQQFNLDLGRQEGTIHHYANVIPRVLVEQGKCDSPMLARFTPSVYNWTVIQIDNPRIGDITDIDKGFDLSINLSEQRRGKRTFNKYTPSFVPRETPLHEDNNIAMKWLKSMIDLDRLYKPPEQEDIDKLNDAAGKIMKYYTRKFRDDAMSSNNRTSTSVAANVDHSASSEIDDRRRAIEEANRGNGGGNNEPKHETSQEPNKDKEDNLQQVATVRDSNNTPKTLDEINPRNMPLCFAGLPNPEPHSDGSVGYNEELEKCMVCKHELKCLDIQLQKGQ